MSFKFFRPWENNGEASTSQARTHSQGSAAEAPEDPANSLLSLEPLAGSIRLDLDVSELDKDADCHGGSMTQELLHDLDSTRKTTCFTSPSTDESGTTFPFITLREHPSLGNASQMICTHKDSNVIESSMTSDVSRNSSSASCPSNSAAESDFCVNITPDRTENPGQNPAIAKTNNRVDNATGLDKALKVHGEHLPFEPEQDMAASRNVYGEKCQTQSKPFKCTSCNKAFSKSNHLCVHKRIHTGSKPFKCRFCEKCFTQSSSLNRHERTHTGSKPSKCTVCMKVFIASSNLRMHERTHTGYRPFQCKICGKEFARSSNLRVHECTHTRSKPFKCRFCEKSFSQSSDLHRHEQTHKGYKPFKCMVCTKAFTHSSSIRRHERIHIGLRPFQCRFCGKDFAQSWDLHVHERTHTGSKPFKCKFCEKSFTQSGNLHRHEQTHGGCKPFKCTILH